MSPEKTKSRMLLTAEPGFGLTDFADQSKEDSQKIPPIVNRQEQCNRNLVKLGESMREA
jgi:hypothetical protein